MFNFDAYIFILCLVVFSVLTLTLAFLIGTVVKLTVSLIRVGEKDAEIIREYKKKKKKIKNKRRFALDCTVSGLLCGLLLLCFSFSLYVNLQQDKTFESIPTVKIVKSASMASKHEKNTYLVKNKLDNQLQVFDLILTYKAPAEKDLKLYDIVVYEQDDILVVHRIVGIEEPNAEHPNERYFLCQGDAMERPDKFPVRYSQIKGIYKDTRVPYVGSFIMFMQSPAGWLCIMLVMIALIATPLVERKIRAEEAKRLDLYTAVYEEDDGR